MAFEYEYETALQLVEFDFETGQWSDFTHLALPAGSLHGAPFVRFIPGETHPFKPITPIEFVPGAQGNAIMLMDGQAVAVPLPPILTDAPTYELEFYSNSSTGFQGFGITDDLTQLPPRMIRCHGDGPSPTLITDNALPAYQTQNEWHDISNVAEAGTAPLSGKQLWLVVVAMDIGAGNHMAMRSIRFGQQSDLAGFFSKAMNYRGNAMWLARTSKTGELVSCSLSKDHRLHIAAAAPEQRGLANDGQYNSPEQHALVSGHPVPFLDRLLTVSPYVGSSMRWDAPGVEPHLNVPQFRPFRVSFDPKLSTVTAAQANPAPERVELREFKGERASEILAAMLGGISHAGWMFHLNVLGQIVRVDDRTGVAKLLFDIPRSLPEFDAGVTMLETAGPSSGHDMVLTRTGPLPYNLPESLRGMGCLGVEFWDAFARLEIIDIPTCDPKVASLVGRTGFFTGTSYHDGYSERYWAALDDGRALFTSSTDGQTWERQALPRGTLIRSFYAFAGAFLNCVNGEAPVFVKMFEHAGDLYVLWTFGMQHEAGPAGSPAWPNNGAMSLAGTRRPPSMIARFHYDADADLLLLVNTAELQPFGYRMGYACSAAVVDERSGLAWVVYAISDFPDQTIRAMSIDLETLEVCDRGQIFSTTRNLLGSIDLRNRFHDSGVASLNFLEPQAYIDTVAIDAGKAHVTFRLSTVDARRVSIRVRMALRSSDGERRDFHEVQPISGLLDAMASAVGEGMSHTLVFALPVGFVGFVQFEILPFDSTLPVEKPLGSPGVPAALPTPMQITSPADATGEEGYPFTYQITATGSPTHFTAIDLPAGLTLDENTGIISGALPWTCGFTVGADGPNGFCWQVVHITVTQHLNQPPTVDAGADLAVLLPAIGSLTSVVTDDGITPGVLSYQWTQISGPDTAVFATPTEQDTTVTFPVAGTYEFQIAVADGEFTVTDSVSAVVSPAVPVTAFMLSGADTVQGLSASLQRVVTKTQPSFAGVKHVVIAFGRLYAWSFTGRYVSCSSNWGSTWNNFDYGTDQFPTGMNVVLETYNGAMRLSGPGKVMLAYNPGSASIAPTMQLDTGSLSMNSPSRIELDPVNGRALFIGSAIILGPSFIDAGVKLVSEVGGFARAISTNSYHPNFITKTTAGTYLVSLYGSFGGATGGAIARSTNLTSWPLVATETVSEANSYNSRVHQLPSGRLVYVSHRAAGKVIRYSDNDGVTWAAATHPAMPAGVNAGSPKWMASASQVVVLCADNTAIVSADGATWTRQTVWGVSDPLVEFMNAYTAHSATLPQ